jgi:hypothetical protein
MFPLMGYGQSEFGVAAFVGLLWGFSFPFRAGLAWRFVLGLGMASSCFATHTAWILHTVKGLSKGQELDIRTGGSGGSLGKEEIQVAPNAVLTSGSAFAVF